jgi:hypothetical protein
LRTVSVQRTLFIAGVVGGAVLVKLSVGATTCALAVDVGTGTQPPLQVALAVLVTLPVVVGAR